MSADAELCLAVDLGTGGPKVGIVTLDGEVLAHEVHRVATLYGDDGAATQDAAEWWSLVTAAAARLLRAPGVSAARVRAVAVTGQYASTVPVDEAGTPTGPCLTWLDTRGGPHARDAIGGRFQGYRAGKALRFIRRTGGAPSTAGADPVGQVLFLTHERPEQVAATRWFMEPVDYLTMRFSGVASATHASRLAMWMTDNRELDRYEYDPQLLRSMGLRGETFPPLVPFASVIGTVSGDVASMLGLARETAVVAGAPDLHAAALGSGATRLYETHLALSTTSWISCPVPAKKTDISHSIAAVPGLSNDSYLVINNQETGAGALEWLRGMLSATASRAGIEDMTSLAATAPPGARGVLFSPWLAGERSPIDDKSLRAGFTNLSVTTSTADLVRATMEGVAANSAWLFRHVERFAGRSLGPVRMLGGGAQSELWCQIYADTLGVEVEQVPQPLLAQLRGAALLAAVALRRRRVGDPTDTPRGRVFSPDATLRDLYRTRAAQLPQLYERDHRWAKRLGVT